MLKNILLFLSILFLLSNPVIAKENMLIPRKVLFGNPTRANPRISPDGKRLSYIAPYNGVMNVWVRTIGKNDDKVITNDKKRGIYSYIWAYDNKHILYVQDKGGDENWNLYRVGIDKGNIDNLTPYKKVKVGIINLNKDYPNEALIAMNKNNPCLFDVYRLYLDSGKIELEEKNPGNVIAWVSDSHLKIKGASRTIKDASMEFIVKDSKGSWKSLVTWEVEDRMNSGPVCFTKNGKYIYLRDSRNANTSRLVKMDVSSGKIKVLAEDPRYDIGKVITNSDTYEVEAVSFIKDRKVWKVLAPSFKKDLEEVLSIDKGDFYLLSRDVKQDNWVVCFVKDNGPVSYYVFNRKDSKGRFLFVNRPELEKYTLASMEPISIKARDGLPLEGYITFPIGKEKKDLPMVLLVHGGPWSRDLWGYHPQVQWLANRGYAVLQINFRGSTGYGKDFINAANREWAGKMHDDLIDAVHWAIKKGYADPKKVAIFGGSYGGYAALVGATFTPDFFCCAVDIVGPSNLITLFKNMPPYWKLMESEIIRRVGDPFKEEEFLKSRSPLFKAHKIKIPILIAQGANDPRVKQQEADQIVEALKKNNIPYEYVLMGDEGHGFVKPENRLKFFAQAEKFLHKCLGGRYEPLKK